MIKDPTMHVATKALRALLAALGSYSDRDKEGAKALGELALELMDEPLCPPVTVPEEIDNPASTEPADSKED